MNQYLGRQPILKHEDGIYAYDLFYRDASALSEINNDRQATATVVMSVLNKFGTKEILGGHPAFVKVDRTFLMHDLIWSIPKEFFILSLLEDIDLDARVIERIGQMHAKGYRLAINDMALTPKQYEKFKPVLNHFSFCKINTLTSDPEYLAEGIVLLKHSSAQLIATKVETREQNERLHALGISLFQGYYFAEPNLLENKKLHPRHLSVMRLCNMLMSEASIEEITAAFEENHALSLQLLRFVNSAAFHFQKQISSIRQVLTLLGRNPLTQWLLLMVYSKSVSKTEEENSPLMLMVKARTELMTGIVKLLPQHHTKAMVSESYFVAVLSLMDTLFSVSLETILDELNVTEEIKGALLDKRGILGEVYSLVNSIEHNEISALKGFIVKFGIREEAFEKLLVDAIENVNAFEQTLAQREKGA